MWHPAEGRDQLHAGIRLSALKGGKARVLIRKHDHFTPTMEIKRHVRALARNHPEGWKLQGHVGKASLRTAGVSYQDDNYAGTLKQGQLESASDAELITCFRR